LNRKNTMSLIPERDQRSAGFPTRGTTRGITGWRDTLHRALLLLFSLFLPSSLEAQPRILWGAATSADIYKDTSARIVSIWYNGPGDLGWMRGYKNTSAISNLYGAGKAVQLIVWLADAGRVDASGNKVPAKNPDGADNLAYAAATPYFLSEQFHADIRELAEIFRGQGPHYGPLYVVLFTEIETYYDLNTTEGRARRDALKAGYIRAAATIRSTYANAFVGLGLGGYAWPAAPGGNRSDLAYWEEALAASDFACFQNMQKYDHWQEAAGQTRNAVRQLGATGLPVMLAHFELWPGGTHNLTEQIITSKLAFNAYMDDVLSEESFAALHAQGLRAWIWKSPVNAGAHKLSGNYIRNYTATFDTGTLGYPPGDIDHATYATLQTAAAGASPAWPASGTASAWLVSATASPWAGAAWTGSAPWLFDPSSGEDDAVYARIRDFVAAHGETNPQLCDPDARTLVAWRFNGLADGTPLAPANAAPSVLAAGVTAGLVTQGTGVSFAVTGSGGNPAPALMDDMNTAGVNRRNEAAALANDEYLSFTVTPPANQALELAALEFDLRARTLAVTGTHTNTYHAALYSSVAGFTGTAVRVGAPVSVSVLSTGGGNTYASEWLPASIPLGGLATDAGQPVEFRLYFWCDTPLTSGFEKILLECDNFAVRGFLGAAPPPAAPPGFAPGGDLPAAQTVTAGGTVTLSVSATGAPPLHYVWKKNGADISDAPAHTFTAATADDGSRFSVTVSNTAGSANSSELMLTVDPPPPASVTVTFDAQGGTLAQQDATKTVTQSAPYGALPAPACAGHTFAGWWTAPGGAGAQVTKATLVIADAGNHTLYAKWTANPPPAPELSVGKIILSLPPTMGGAATFPVSGNVTWTVQPGAGWLAATPVAGAGGATVTITATSANTADRPRSASVTVSGGDILRTVIVTQRAVAGAGQAPASLADGAVLRFTFVNHDGAPESWSFTVAPGGNLVGADVQGSLSIPCEYEAAGDAATLVFLDNVWALDFAARAFRLHAFDADGPYEIDGTFTYTSPAPPLGDGGNSSGGGGNGGGGATSTIFWLALALLVVFALSEKKKDT
jgi:uncharacterized repeat protein (TIGR02543 family)